MRIYPVEQRAAAAAGGRINLDQDFPEHPSDEPRKPIISVRGQDLN
jgi:hypothetical protein